jgi:hypothetical protein
MGKAAVLALYGLLEFGGGDFGQNLDSESFLWQADAGKR